MPPVNIKFVVSFTSQDDNFKAENLITSDGYKKWLSNPKEKPGETSVTLQLESLCVISFIDIGTQWCANIEIQVGRSDWPQGKEYETLAPTCIMMKPMDCNLGRNFACTRMFSGKDFNSEVASKMWDRVRIICRQPLRKDVQFGLSFLHIKTTSALTGSNEGTSPLGQKSVKSIQKHFFGNSKSSASPSNEVKTKLLRMAGSTENGTDQESAMTRTAKLVLAASTGNKQRDITPTKSPFYSDMLVQKYGPEFKEEVEIFLRALEIKEDELDRVTIADLRHKLEKKKKRKLEKDERKTFAELARNYICKLFSESDDEIKNSLKSNDKNNIKYEETNQKEDGLSDDKTKSNCADNETYGDFNLKNGISSPETTKIDVKSKSKSDITEQLNQIRKNAQNAYRSNIQKNQISDAHLSLEQSNDGNSVIKADACFNVKNNSKISVSEDSTYKSMSYLERKAFALTNPYKANRYGNSLTFGPSKSENNCLYESSDNLLTSNTNDTWLSTASPRNNVMMTPPNTRGKRKRVSSGARGGRASKVQKKLDENDNSSPVEGKRGRGRGRGKSMSSKEIRPTSFERCPHCQDTFPPSQLSEHRIICAKDQSASSDVEEVIYSGPKVVDKLRSPEYMECPMCSGFYGSDVIQFHAAVCGDNGH